MAIRNADIARHEGYIKLRLVTIRNESTRVADGSCEKREQVEESKR